MKAKELKELEIAELEEKLQDLKKELFSIKFQKVFAVLDSPAVIRNLKKDIARCKTVINEKSSVGS